MEFETEIPVWGFKNNNCTEKLEQIGTTKTVDLKSMYWKCYAHCHKGNHVMVLYDIVKQPHCPVCEPNIDMREHWVTIWNDPCPKCGKM